VDESSYLRYARMAKDRADSADLGLTVPVKLKLIDEPSFKHTGRLDFVDNAINRSTGTIRARAVFANPNRTFTPGMFARLQMAAAPPADTLLVPEAAIGAEQARKFVMVVDAATWRGRNTSRSGPWSTGCAWSTE
jgi:multidrug efflux pump subunit AcrA (membrane-fusion protein)